MTGLRTFGLCLAAAAMLATGTAAANPSQAFDNTKKICAEAAARTEHAEGVPRLLLRAISLAETGRWDGEQKASFAWPWVVTAEGEGRYFPTKAAAIAAVRKLSARGIRNIDVGCMQINLMYHAKAFPNLETAFDPARNTRYAADYLNRLHGETGSWTRAIAFYHSREPRHHRPYKMKVLGLWKEARRRSSGEAPRTAPASAGYPAATAAAPIERPPARIDRARTAELNARMKANRAAARALDRATRRHRQLDAWREKRIGSLAYVHTAAMRRAEAQFQRNRQLRERLKAASGEDRRARFDDPRLVAKRRLTAN